VGVWREPASGHAAWVADSSDTLCFEERRGLSWTCPEQDLLVLRRYQQLREHAFEKEGVELHLDSGLIAIVGKFTGCEEITLFLLQPYLAGLISRRQIRTHLKAEVGRRNEWAKRGGEREIGDSTSTRRRRRQEIIDFHKAFARRRGWSFPVLTCSPERLISELVDEAICNWDRSEEYLGARRFPRLMYRVARQRGQFVDLRRRTSAPGKLYCCYLGLLCERLEARGIPRGNALRRSLSMKGNRRRRGGDRTVNEIAPPDAVVVPGSGSGHRKGDLEVGQCLVEVKAITSGRARVREEQLTQIEEQAEASGRLPLLVLALEDGESRSLIAIIREEDTSVRLLRAPKASAVSWQKHLRLSTEDWREIGAGDGHWILLKVGGHFRRYRVIGLPDLESTTISQLLGGSTG
jgi:hypothetical protein